MPLSEDEQRILEEIEARIKESDPALADHISESTLYRHAWRNIKWAVVGFVAGLALLVFTFTRVLLLGVVGFLVMLVCLLVIERNVRKMGRAGFDSITGSMRGGALKGMFDRFGERWRERWRRDDN
ncbi:MAG: DUF3040 domain-containing protein [Acidimicrobiia bacterium]